MGLCVAKWLGAFPVAGSALAVAASDACPGYGALAPGHIALNPGRIGCLSSSHRGAPPVSIYAALIGRTLNRCGRAQSQAAPGTLPVSRQATRLGAFPVLRCWASSCMPYVVGRTSATGLCNYTPFTEDGRTPRPSVATWAPSMPTPPLKRLRNLPSWSVPMAIAGILPLASIKLMLYILQSKSGQRGKVGLECIRYEPRVEREGNVWESKSLKGKPPVGVQATKNARAIESMRRRG